MCSPIGNYRAHSRGSCSLSESPLLYPTQCFPLSKKIGLGIYGSCSLTGHSYFGETPVVSLYRKQSEGLKRVDRPFRNCQRAAARRAGGWFFLPNLAERRAGGWFFLPNLAAPRAGGWFFLPNLAERRVGGGSVLPNFAAPRAGGWPVLPNFAEGVQQPCGAPHGAAPPRKALSW